MFENNEFVYDENGDSRIPRSYLKGALLIPPDVVLDKERDVLQFPVLKNKKDGQRESEFSNDQHLSYVDIVETVLFAGWKFRKPEFDKAILLQDIFQLEKASQEEILRFAKKWGPLWKCTKHKQCFMNPYPFKQDGQCLWSPEEKVEDYRTLSKLMNAIAITKSDKMVELLKAWGKNMFPEEYGFENAIFKSVLDMPHNTNQLMARLFSLFFQVNLLTVSMEWGLGKEEETRKYKHKHESSPTIEFNTGLGYVRIGMLSLFHNLSGTSGLAVCSECNEPYFRKERNAKKGQKNYCPKCREKMRKDKGKKS